MSNEIGIDLGTCTTLIYVRDRGVVLREPTILAYDKEAERIVEIGQEASVMLGRTPENISSVRPVVRGVISDYTNAEHMLKYFIKAAVGRNYFGRRPVICISVPSAITEVERRAVEEVTYSAGARDVTIIEAPIAAAIGAGLDIVRPIGSMVVDIGGGITDIAVISMGGTVISSSCKTAGADFDEAIGRYIRKKYNLLIGERTEEEIKINIGTCYRRPENISMDIRGRDMITGLPKTITFTSDESEEALREETRLLIDAIMGVLERTPPELAADISDRGIVLTGGGALLHGLERLIEEKTGITTVTAEDALSATAIGTGKYISLESRLR